MRNFVNPKKIKGQDKLDRIKDLMGKMSTLNESTSLSEIENVKKGANGVTYAIIRENQNYFIKTTEKTSGTLMSEDFQYIGGLQNKNLERYNSYAEALKQLNLKFDMLNESYGVKGNINLFESDATEVKVANASGVVMKEEEPELIEDQKSVIKVDVPASEAPVEDEVEELDVEEGGEDEDPFADEEGGDEDMSMDMEVEEEGDEEEGDGYTKKIQKLTGKIGQLLRDKDEPDAELDKYVINSIVAAIDWEEIPDEDVEDIIAKIEGEDEEDGELEGDEDMSMDMEVEEGGEDEDPFADEEGGEDEDPFAEEELSESDEKKSKNGCVELIKTLKSAIEKFEGMLGDSSDNSVKTWVKQMIADHKKMLTKIENECKGIQIDESDEPVEEGNAFTLALAKAKEEGKDEFEVDGKTHKVQKESKTYSKKSLMENFLKKNINNSLNKILKEYDESLMCEVCGEIHEGDCATHIDEDLDINNEREYDTWDDYMSSDFSDSRLDIKDRKFFDSYRNKYGRFRVKPEGDSYVGTFGSDDNDIPWKSIYESPEMSFDDNPEFLEIIKQNIKSAHDRGEKSPWDEEETAQVAIEKGWAPLDEDLDYTNDLSAVVGDDVGVVHEEDMSVVDAIATGQNYLQASGDLDRDGDQIPNRLDMDSNMDGELDHPTFNDEEFIEIDFDSLMGNSPAPTKEPGIAPPSTRPGKKKPRWKKIPRPDVNPNPKALSDKRKFNLGRRGMYR